MDIYGYKSFFDETSGVLPSVRLVVAEQSWPTGQGYHPSLVKSQNDFYAHASRQPFADAQYEGPYAQYALAPRGQIFGHNTADDAAFQRLLPDAYPAVTSPLFVKDLAGRVIYTGLGPERKTDQEWLPDMRELTFPRGCEVVDGNVDGAELIENIFMTSFRCLDMSLDYDGTPADEPNQPVAGFYDFPNLYPYKLRLDTFYADGWKLPQTQLLYVHDTVLQRQAEEHAAQLMRRWTDRPESQPYEAFYADAGEDFFERLFKGGCTLIPTLEACNGYNKVGRNFDLQDYWPGRAVKGLHDIVDRRRSDAPEGTILEVLQPGYLLAHRVEPAKVIVSDGTDYVSPNTEDPEPKVIDIRLPHQRASAKWGAVWVPTHPKHFEAPALWGWEDESGHFVQLRGPIWDPLHYYYDSVNVVIKAYATNQLPQNRWLVRVPDTMRLQFYPAIPMRGFDVHDVTELTRRRESLIKPFTCIKRFDDGKPSCDVGYHPLPLQFEYELDNWWFPYLHPRNRRVGELSFKLEDRVCPVVSPKTTPREYIPLVVAPEDAPWFNAFEQMQIPTDDPLENYPALNRYKGQVTLSDMKMLTYLHLQYQLFAQTLSNSSQIEYNPREFEQVETVFPGLYQIFKFLDLEALQRAQIRQELFIKHYDAYLMAWWNGDAPETLYPLLESPQSKRSGMPSAATMGVGTV